jgi:hypothetical protein
MRLATSMLGLASALAACDVGVGPQNGPLRLSVTVARSVIDVGDTTTVTATLRNLGTESVTLTGGVCQILPLPYIAIEPTREIIYPKGGDWICIEVLTRLTLAPGAEETRTLVVTGVAPPAPPDLAVPLGRGQYHIYAVLNSPEFPLRVESVLLTVR